MRLNAKLLPWLSIGIGVPFLLIRIGILFKGDAHKPPAEIMDIGFMTGEDPKDQLAGFVRISLFIVFLYLAIWIFGFHIALPGAIFLCLLVCGHAGWTGSVIAGLAFAALLLGVFDWVSHIPWHEPLISRWMP